MGAGFGKGIICVALIHSQNRIVTTRENDTNGHLSDPQANKTPQTLGCFGCFDREDTISS